MSVIHSNYKDAPQVGDVVINGDDDKINNLSKLLYTELTNRKKLFTSFGGNYSDYIKYSGKLLPNVIVVVNVVETLNENNCPAFFQSNIDDNELYDNEWTAILDFDLTEYTKVQEIASLFDEEGYLITADGQKIDFTLSFQRT